MSIHVHIDLEFSPRQKRAMRAGVVAGVVLSALSVGVALAYPYSPQPKTPLLAADLTKNFDHFEQKTGFVGSIRMEGPSCSFVAHMGTSATTFLGVAAEASTACTIKATAGDIPGATLAAGDITPGTPLSVKLTGPAGHYMLVATGDFYPLNGNSGTKADRAIVAVRLIDGMTGASGGSTVFGHIAGGVSTPNTRYHHAGLLNAGFTYASAVNTTISLQVANISTVDNTDFNAYTQNNSAPIEIRVYKL